MGKPFRRAGPPSSPSAIPSAAGLQVFAPARLEDHDAIAAAVEELNEAVLQNASVVLQAALDRLDPAANLARVHPRALYALPYIISGAFPHLVATPILIKALSFIGKGC